MFKERRIFHPSKNSEINARLVSFWHGSCNVQQFRSAGQSHGSLYIRKTAKNRSQLLKTINLFSVLWHVPHAFVKSAELQFFANSLTQPANRVNCIPEPPLINCWYVLQKLALKHFTALLPVTSRPRNYSFWYHWEQKIQLAAATPRRQDWQLLQGTTLVTLHV